jgi:hypothetical protein
MNPEETIPEPIQPEHRIAPLHTYASDMAEALKENQGSVIKIALDEQHKREADGTARKEKPKNRIFLFASILLIALGAVSYYGITWYAAQNAQAPVVIDTTIKQQGIVFANGNRDISITTLTSDGLQNTLAPLLATAGTSTGTLTKFSLTTPGIDGSPKQLDARTVFSLLAPSARDTLGRSLGTDYMVGTYDGDKTYFFALFTTDDYDTTLAELLRYEGKMFDDWYRTFTIPLSAQDNLFQKTFTDKVLYNKDTRVLQSGTGNSLLIYGFLDSKTFIVTNSEQALQEISLRLAGQKK